MCLKLKFLLTLLVFQLLHILYIICFFLLLFKVKCSNNFNMEELESACGPTLVFLLTYIDIKWCKNNNNNNNKTNEIG